MTVIINLIIAHSHPHFLFMLQNIIRSYQGFRVVGKTGNYADLMQMATALNPDVIIADIELPGMSGFTALQQLVADLNQPKIILSWGYHHQPFISEAIAAGCAGCIIHDANPAEYHLAIKQAMKGEVFYCSQTERVMNGIKNLPGTGNVPAQILSETQFKIMYCIWLGYNSKGIALAMDLTKETVDTYRKALRKIVGSLSSAALYSFLKNNGLV